MRKSLMVVLAVAALAVAGCGGGKTAAPAKPGRPAQSNLPKMWDFWAVWCGPCKEMKPIVEALAEEYKGKIEITSINVDESKDLASEYKVAAIPTLVFLDAKGKELSRIVGLVPKDTIVARFKTHGFIQ
jgi:thioredoxin 1